MIKFSTSLFLLFITLNLIGQTQYPIYQNYDWEIDAKYQGLPEDEKDEKEVVLKYKRVKEYEYGYNSFVEYFTVHKITHVNSDDAIERNNKIYIYVGGNNELVEAKARVIKKNGETQYFDTENILESDELDEHGAYKYFPLDGLELGSNVEYLYTIKKSPYLNGARYSLQEDFIMHNVSFDIVCPSNLIYAFKSYNDCPEFTLDSLDDTKNHYSVSIDKSDKLPDEQYSVYDASLKYFVFKLDANTSNGAKNLITNENMAQEIFKLVNDDISKKETKSAAKYLKKMAISDQLSDEEKIRQIESYVKNDIIIAESIPLRDISDIISKKFAGSIGATRLFVLLLKEIGVNYELGFSTNRFDKTFDPDFPSYYLFDEFFIYFPDQKLYMDPQKMTSRLGYLGSEYSNTDAVHIKPINVAGFESGIGKVKFIPSIPYDKNIDRMFVDLNFSDFEETKINFKRELTGYQAIELQPMFKFMDENKAETEAAYCKFADDEGELGEYKVLNATAEDAGVNPLIFEGKLKSDRYITNADGKYLLKIGLAIGQQSELYSENNRVLPIVNHYNRGYIRTITFEIPEGYQCSNLDILNVSQTYPEKDPTCQFVSSYKLEGNTVTVEVIEFYNKITYKVDEYPNFQRVINAAADFNKLTLIFEPTK